MTIGYPGVGGDLPVVMTPEVVSELVPEAVVAGGAGLLGHGEGDAVFVGVEVAHPAPGQRPGYQRRGVRGVPQGGVRPLNEGGICRKQCNAYVLSFVIKQKDPANLNDE